MASSSSTSSVTLLASVIKQLSSTGDAKSREFEKDRISQELKNADEKLAELVDGNQDHLKKAIQSFGSVCTRVQQSRARIRVLHDKLSRCRKLLHCNRDDLKVHWQEGLECTEKLFLLDKIEKAIAVPEKLDRYISKKHFLHASELLVETVENLDGNLSNVEALRDLRASLHSRKEQLHENIIEELNKQILSEPNQKLLKKSADLRPEAFDPQNCLFEDLQKDPEDNLPKFIYLMVESLIVLGRIPEAVETFKGRIKRDMLMVVRRATDQVAKRAIDHCDVLAAEELTNKSDSKILLELLEVTFEKFRSISANHKVLLTALQSAKNRLPTEKAQEIHLYTNEDIWSKIQFAIKDILHPYLDIQNIALPHAQQALASFGNSESHLGAFFTAKKRLNMNVGPSNKQRSTQLFKFECSSSAEAIHSYMREQDIASSLLDEFTDFIVWNPPQLLCKPLVKNITIVFLPVVEFVKEIDRKTSSKLGSSGVLFNFVSDFVQKVFLDQVLYEVSEKASAVTKGHDALRNLCDSHTQRDLNLTRPLLKSALVIYHVSQYLLELMRQLPQYSTELMEILIGTLSEYYESCYNSYKALVFRDIDGKGMFFYSILNEQFVVVSSGPHVNSNPTQTYMTHTHTMTSYSNSGSVWISSFILLAKI